MHPTQASRGALCARAHTSALRTTLTALACTAPALAAAQTADADATRIPPVVVTATRIAQALSEALPATTVITREDIERSQATNLLDLIRRAPGVEIAQLGGIGHQASVLLRGTETRHVLVLVDGVPINNLNFSIASLDQLQTSQVDHVEIARGNVSALYGAQAVGGVIQVFTRRGTGPAALDAAITLGARNTREGRAGVSGASGGWRYALGAARLTTDGFDVIDHVKRPGTNPDRDGYENTSGSAQLSYAPGADHEFGLRLLHTRGVVRYDSEFGPADQADVSTQTIETQSAYSRNRWTEGWTSTLDIGQTRDKLDAAQTAYPYYVTSKGTQASWQNDIRLAANWTLSLAAEHLRQTIASDTAYTKTARTVDTLRAGTVGASGPHRVQFNLRHDKYSDFGSHATWYAGYGHALDPHWMLIASASTAFNAPTFNDLFYPWGGNPDLDPENSRAFEAGAQYARGATLVRAVAFKTRIRDLIGYDQAFNRVNIDRATVTGAEFSAKTDLGAWRASAALTVQSADDDTTGERLVRRARTFGHLSLGRTIGAWDFEGAWRASGDRVDRASGERVTLGGHGVVDVSARWSFAPHWRLGLRAENLLDKTYENAWGYPAAGRAAFVTLQYDGR